MNSYTYPQHQQSPQHQQLQSQQQHPHSSSPATPQSAGINPAMLQGPQTQTQMHAQQQAAQAQFLARQQQMMSGLGSGGMGGMNSMSGAAGMNGMGSNMGGMSGMGMHNGAMNIASMGNRMNNMAGMNVPGMGNMGAMGMNNMTGMGGMAGMNNMNMELFKAGGMGASGAAGMNLGMGMGMDSGMTINPAMLSGSASTSNQGGMNPPSGMSSQDLQKMMAARQAALNMGGMSGMNSLNNMTGIAGMGGMNGMAGMNMGMGVMGGNAQQQALMQQYLVHQAHQQQSHQQQSQSQAHSPQSSTQTPASTTGGNPYPPFPTQSQSQQMQAQNTNVHSMPPPPPRPSTAMSTSSQHQHQQGIGIGRPPSAIHQQQQQQQYATAMHNQQGHQQMNHASISRPTTAAGFRPPSSAGDAPRTPHTPQLVSQQSQALSNLHNQAQSQGQQHIRELSQTPSRPQTAASNHGAGQQGGVSGKYPLGMGGIGMGGMTNMNNMNNMGAMGLMGAAGGGMMPPPTLPRQSSLGPTPQPQSSMQAQGQPMQSQQQMQHHQPQGMISTPGHGSPMSATAPGSGGLTRTASFGEGLGGISSGAALDDAMGNMSSVNTGLGMSASGLPNSGMPSGMGSATATGIGGGMGGVGMVTGGASGTASAGAGVGLGGIGVGGLGGMSQMQHMQEMQNRRAIALSELQKQQAARLQQQQQQQAHGHQGQQGQPQQGHLPNVNTSAPVAPSPGVAPSIPSAGVMPGGDAQSMGMVQPQIPGAGMNVGMGTPSRPPTARTSMPPPGSGPLSMGGATAGPSASAGVGTNAVAPPATASSTSSLPNGAIPPTTGSANATASTGPTVQNAQQNALAASLPPLPSNVQLSASTTRVSVVPIAESAKRIPPLSQEEIEKISGWLSTDRAYEQNFRVMATRAKAELAIGPNGVQRPRWWERDTTPASVAAATARRAKMEKFDLIYPHGSAQASREAAAAAARRKNRRRDGLKIPGRLKHVDADRGEQLVPIRLEFDVEHHKYRDTFVWNINDPIVTPEAFAQSLIDDYGLSTSYHSIITKSIQEQLSDYKAHTATLADVSSDVDVASNGEPKAPPIKGSLELDGEDAKWWASWRTHLRKKDGMVRKNALLKELAVEIAKNERTRKRKRTAKDTGSKESAAKDTAKESVPKENASNEESSAIANVEETKPPESTPAAEANTDVDMHEAEEDDIHEEMRILIKLDITVGEMKLDDQFEWDIENIDPTPEQFAEVYCTDLGLAGEFKTAIAHSIREQVATYQKSLFLVGHPSDGSAVQDDDLRMSLLSPVISAARSIDQTQAHQPIINYLSDGELDRLDKEREKEANKRRKRNTRGRRGIVLPDREPIRTHRTPAIGFPEIDPSTLAIAAAAAAPTSRRAAAAAASLTIANMVASENGTTILPPVNPTPAAPMLPASKIPKPRGSFKAPSYPSSILKPRAHVTSPSPSTVVDTSVFQPPIEGDAPLPASVPATPSAPQSRMNQGPMTAKRQRELEKEAKEREFADGQHANMIDGVWHCSNCGCPESVAIGRRKGPLGEKSHCGACGKFWHRHRRPRPCEYHTDPEYHLNLRIESERAKASAKKRGGAAALRALLQKEQDQAATPASATDEPSSPRAPKNNEVWVEIKSTRKSARQSPVVDGLDLERPLTPASDVSSDGSEKPLAQSRGQANGRASVSKPTSTVATPSKAVSELPVHLETSMSAPPLSSPPSRSGSAAVGEPSSARASSAAPAQDGSSDAQQRPPPIQRPHWQDAAMAELQSRYPDDRFEIILRKSADGSPPVWRVKCLDCPGKLYTPGPNETLSNFEVHLKNRQHRAKVHARLQGGST